jgi:hypothetical protein
MKYSLQVLSGDVSGGIGSNAANLLGWKNTLTINRVIFIVD